MTQNFRAHFWVAKQRHSSEPLVVAKLVAFQPNRGDDTLLSMAQADQMARQSSLETVESLISKPIDGEKSSENRRKEEEKSGFELSGLAPAAEQTEENRNFQDAHPQIKNEPEARFDNLSLSSQGLMIAGFNHPVELHEQYKDTLAIVTFREAEDLAPCETTVDTLDNGCLVITHTHHGRYGEELSPEEAALIARTFLLANISLFRKRARSILTKFDSQVNAPNDQNTDPAPHKPKIAQLKNSKNAKGDFSSLSDKLAQCSLEFRESLKPNKFAVAITASLLMWGVWGALLTLFPTLSVPGKPSHFFEPHQATWLILSLLMAGLTWHTPSGRRWRHTPYIIGIASSAALPGAILTWLLWPSWMYAHHGQTPVEFDTTIQILLALAGLAFLLLTGNFEASEHKRKLEAYNQAKEEFDRLLSDLAQTNANVASLHLVRDGKADESPLVPELILRKVDALLQTKEAVVSLESVIRARQRYVHDNVSEILDNQQQVRRSVLAAGSGMLAGYITFDAGSAVMQYIDLPVGYDGKSYDFWMATQMRNILSAPEKNPNEAIVECSLQPLPYPPNGGTNAFSTLSVKIPRSKCSSLQEMASFRSKYHEDELMDTGLLLTITFIVSLLAAWIAARKPEKELSGA